MQNAAHHLAAQWVERCLGVTTAEAYAQVSGELAATLDRAPDQGSMIVVRVKDGAGRPVKDFDVYLTAGPAYDPGHLPKNFFIDRQRNQVTPNALTYYVDHRVFQQTRELGLRIRGKTGGWPGELSGRGVPVPGGHGRGRTQGSGDCHGRRHAGKAVGPSRVPASQGGVGLQRIPALTGRGYGEHHSTNLDSPAREGGDC